MVMEKRFATLTHNVADCAEWPHLTQIERYYRIAEAGIGRPLSRVPMHFGGEASSPGLESCFGAGFPVAVHLGNGGSNLDWGDVNFAALIRRLNELACWTIASGDAGAGARYPQKPRGRQSGHDR
jgi:hypothetical protein